MSLHVPHSIAGKQKNLLLYQRWPWHLLFWTGYALFRFWLYYITVKYYPAAFLEYMLLSEALLIVLTYATLGLYQILFQKKKYLFYFGIGATGWIAFLWAKTVFQFHYLKNEPQFQANTFTDIFLNSITGIIVYFLFLTACKYFKDGFVSQQAESERKSQQLIAEVNNLKSQIAPHFLFNTLNNLYGLAVDRSEKLPELMLRLSHLLRHSLYETQRPQVPLDAEAEVLKSYVELERIRLEDDLKLEFENSIGNGSGYGIAPMLLIVFVENAFKHSKFIRSGPVHIYIKTALEKGCFTLIVKNNYNGELAASDDGIGLSNVKRRLELLYPADRHRLTIRKDGLFHTVTLQLELDSLNP